MRNVPPRSVRATRASNAHREEEVVVKPFLDPLTTWHVKKLPLSPGSTRFVRRAVPTSLSTIPDNPHYALKKVQWGGGVFTPRPHHWTTHGYRASASYGKQPSRNRPWRLRGRDPCGGLRQTPRPNGERWVRFSREAALEESASWVEETGPHSGRDRRTFLSHGGELR